MKKYFVFVLFVSVSAFSMPNKRENIDNWRNSFQNVDPAEILTQGNSLSWDIGKDATGSVDFNELQTTNFKKNYIFCTQVPGEKRTDETYNLLIKKTPLTEMMCRTEEEIKQGNDHIAFLQNLKNWGNENPRKAKALCYCKKVDSIQWYIKYPTIIATAFGLGWLMNSDSDFLSKIIKK